jgi:hypothetical protein
MHEKPQLTPKKPLQFATFRISIYEFIGIH